MVKRTRSLPARSLNGHPRELLYGAVLAGGLSTRMGCDKRFLTLDGEFLVDRAVRLLSQLTGQVPGKICLCGNVPGRVCIPDFMPGLGPMGGVLSAISYVRAQILVQSSGQNSNQNSKAKSPWLLILPVDMPQLSIAILEKMVAEISHHIGSKSAVIAYQGFEMPFVLRCDADTEKAARAVCQSTLASSRSIRNFQNLIGVYRLSLDPESKDAMLNANSPLDWSNTQKQERK